MEAAKRAETERLRQEHDAEADRVRAQQRAQTMLGPARPMGTVPTGWVNLFGEARR